jgi:hypothetical protein
LVVHRAPLAIQSRLKVSNPGDALEQEADHVAAQVVSAPEPSVQRACHCGGSCPSCKSEQAEEGLLQLKALGPGHPSEGAASADVRALSQSPGKPLDAGTRAFFEPRFGFDFSNVRIHTDRAPADAADRLGAQAFTIGSHIAFARGSHPPDSTAGRLLLAHELTHVVQQSGGSGGIAGMTDEPQVQRLVRTSSVTCPAAATGIASPHTGPADRRASALLDNAITRINNAIAVRAASPADPDVVAVGDALHRVFHLDPAAEATWTAAAPDVALPVILRRVQAVKDYIDSVVFTLTCIPNGGAGHTIAPCANAVCAAGTEAFSCHDNPVEIVLCPDFWQLGLDQRGRTYMHEVFHITFHIINDWGQPNVHNAHCYAQFVALLNGFNSPQGFRCP